MNIPEDILQLQKLPGVETVMIGSSHVVITASQGLQNVAFPIVPVAVYYFFIPLNRSTDNIVHLPSRTEFVPDFLILLHFKNHPVPFPSHKSAPFNAFCHPFFPREQPAPCADSVKEEKSE